mmetsp:Transcript_59730/g.94867  ORF Transcript_59730/g.94867 Transcript_59730/m.94867 type:complete len:474 (-) Transcript_59730:75-1496(-)
MELVNIPSTLEDPEYRYKMPRLISKFEGRGNAIKTCIVNMGDVARALHRPPQYATKWFGSALGVDSQFVKKEGDVEYCYINGSHDVSAFQSLLDEFIDKYVCCEQCRLPEVDMYISKGVVHGKCKACGWTNALDNKHRVAHFIAKHPPDESGFNLKGRKGLKLIEKADSDFSDFDLDGDFGDNDGGGSSIYDGKDDQKEKTEKKHKKEKKDKKDKKEKKHKKDKKDKKEKTLQDEAFNSLLTDEKRSDTKIGSEDNSDIDNADEKVNGWPNLGILSSLCKQEYDDSIDANEALAQQNVSISRPQVCGYNSTQVVNAIEALRQYVKDEGDRLTVEDFFDELRIAQLAEVFDHKVRLYVVLETFLGNNLDEQSVLTHKDHIEQAISSASMRGADVLWAFNAYLQAHPSGAKGFPLVLKTIYDEEWVFEKEFLEHYNCDKFEIDPGFQLAKEHAEPFLRWLGTFESDDEDNNNELV